MPDEGLLVDALKRRRLTLAVAESMTGGLVGATLTRAPGASGAFVGGIVAYVDRAKAGLLGVDADLLAREGAVTPAVALQMAEGVRARLGADFGLSVTGIAGPHGPDALPVGLTYLGIATPAGTTVRERRFEGTRDEVRDACVREALRLALAAVEALGPRA